LAAAAPETVPLVFSPAVCTLLGMAEHELTLEAHPVVARRSDGGGRASCKPCGWVQEDGGLLGSKKRARRAYYRHKEAACSS
jgi:hypothetical protein